MSLILLEISEFKSGTSFDVQVIITKHTGNYIFYSKYEEIFGNRMDFTAMGNKLTHFS
jgi:hypothetical protein